MNLKYITLSQLMSSVESDLYSFADNGMIDRGSMIKVVRKVNEDLGLKIYREREVMLDICNYRAELPEDFALLQLAVACTIQYYHIGQPSFGTVTEEHDVPVNHYHDYGACMNECGGCYWVTQKFKEKTVKYQQLIPLKLTNKTKKLCSDNCMNFNVDTSAYDLDIENGVLSTNFREGKIYINYLADMVNEEGEIILLDHPLTTEYYEYAVKKQLLENFMLNNDADVSQKLMYVKNELRDARVRAMNFVTTPEYTEITKMFQINRRNFYNRYHKMFD